MKKRTSEQVRGRRFCWLSAAAALWICIAICCGTQARGQAANLESQTKAATETEPAPQQEAAAPAQEAPDPEKAYQRGLVAADLQTWDLAIANFAEAQKASPGDMRYLYALGMAHARAGHDLAGAAWLRVYLAAAPKAERADDVRAEIARLEQSHLANEKKIFASAAAAARQIPWLGLRWQQLRLISGREARAGLIDDALALEQEIYALSLTIPKDSPDPPGWGRIEILPRDVVQSWLWSDNVDALATLQHDPGKAMQALAHISDADARASAQMDIAEAMCWNLDGDSDHELAAAAESIAAVADPSARDDGLLDLVDAYVYCREPAQARKQLDEARSFAEKNNLTISSQALQNRLDQLAKADRSEYDEAYKIEYIDEIANRTMIAQTITANAWATDLKAALAQAAQSDPNASGSQSAAIAGKLSGIAYEMGASDLLLHLFDPVNYGGNLLWAQARMEIRCAGVLGNGFAGHIGIDDLRALLASKDQAWRDSEKGKTVLKAIAAVDNSPLEIHWVSDEKGWMAVIVLKPDGRQLYSSDHYPDLISLYNAGFDTLDKAFATWELDDEKSPLSAPYKAAMQAVAGEKLPQD